MSACNRSWLALAGGWLHAVAAAAALAMRGAGLVMAAPAGAAVAPLSQDNRLHLLGDPIDTPPIGIQTRVWTGDTDHQGGVTLTHALTFTNPLPPLAPYIAPTAGNGPCLAGVWVLALDRANLDPDKTISKTFPLCSNADAGALGSCLTALATPAAPEGGSPYLVIVNSIYDPHATYGPSTMSGLGPALAEIGADASGFGFDLRAAPRRSLDRPVMAGARAQPRIAGARPCQRTAHPISPVLPSLDGVRT